MLISKESIDKAASMPSTCIAKGPLLCLTVLSLTFFSILALLSLAVNPGKKLFVIKDFLKKNILTISTVNIANFMVVTINDGLTIIDNSTELNRRPLGLAGPRQTYSFRT